MDEPNYNEILMRLYEITTSLQRSSSTDTILMMGMFAAVFSVSLAFYNEKLIQFIPAFIGFCSLLSIWVITGHFWKMRYYSEGQIIRLEIYKKISENFPDETFPSLKIASYFRRGRFKDDGILAILGVFYVMLGLSRLTI